MRSFHQKTKTSLHQRPPPQHGIVVCTMSVEVVGGNGETTSREVDHLAPSASSNWNHHQHRRKCNQNTWRFKRCHVYDM